MINQRGQALSRQRLVEEMLYRTVIAQPVKVVLIIRRRQHENHIMILDIPRKGLKSFYKFEAVDKRHLYIHHDDDLVAIRWWWVGADELQRFPAVEEQADLFTHAGIKDHFLSDKTIQLIV